MMSKSAEASPDWSEHSRSLGFTMRSLGSRFLFHTIFNAYWEPLTFELPPAPNGEFWRRCIDTALDSPEDVRRWEAAPCVPPAACLVQARSVVLLALPLQRQAGGSLRVTVIK